MAYDPLAIGRIDTRHIEVDARMMRPAQPKPVEGEKPFSQFLTDAVSEMQRLETQADATIKQVVSGEIKDVTEALVAVQQADLARQTLLTVRNRVVAAYEQIIQMQV